MDAFRPTPSLSVYPNPPASGLMATFRAYFDDSKDNRVLTIAGFLSDYESWGRFDYAWKAMLDEFKVPYLHMKEFWNNNGIYKHIKDDPKKEEAFFSELIKVISDHTRYCVLTMVLLEDVKKFNKQQNHQLRAPALAIYGCFLQLQMQFSGRPIEVIFDKFENASSLIELGNDYAETDTQQPINRQLILSIRIQADESCRTILPLQAADFVAWEMRKYCNDPISWISQLRFEDVPNGVARMNFDKWLIEFEKEEGRAPRQRKSLYALKKRCPLHGFLFNYASLEVLQRRHPYGWRTNKSNKRRGVITFSRDQGA